MDRTGPAEIRFKGAEHVIHRAALATSNRRQTLVDRLEGLRRLDFQLALAVGHDALPRTQGGIRLWRRIEQFKEPIAVTVGERGGGFFVEADSASLI